MHVKKPDVISFVLEKYTPRTIQPPIISADLKGYVIAGAIAVDSTYACPELLPNRFLAMEIPAGKFKIGAHAVKVEEDQEIKPNYHKEFITLYFGEVGSIDAELDGFGPVKLTEGMCRMFKVSSEPNKAWIKKSDMVYQFKHVDIPLSWISKMRTQYPHFNEAMTVLDSQVAGVANEVPYLTSHYATLLLQKIQTCTYTEKVAALWNEAIAECLCTSFVVQLENERKIGGVSVKPSPLDPVKMLSDVNILSSRLLTEKQIKRIVAKRLGVSMYAVDGLYKRICYISLRDYLLRIRLERAFELVVISPFWNLIDEERVAAECGFENMNKFVAYFITHFNCTPRQLHRYKIYGMF